MNSQKVMTSKTLVNVHLMGPTFRKHDLIELDYRPKKCCPDFLDLKSARGYAI